MFLQLHEDQISMNCTFRVSVSSHGGEISIKWLFETTTGFMTGMLLWPLPLHHSLLCKGLHEGLSELCIAKAMLFLLNDWFDFSPLANNINCISDNTSLFPLATKSKEPNYKIYLVSCGLHFCILLMLQHLLF